MAHLSVSGSRAPLLPVLGEPAADGSDCVTCGRCCHHAPETVTFLESDELRMGERLLDEWTYVAAKPPHFRFLHNDGVACAALDRTTAGHYPCQIYETRPEGCRTVQAGSPCCLQARALGQLGDNVEFERAPDARAVGVE